MHCKLNSLTAGTVSLTNSFRQNTPLYLLVQQLASLCRSCSSDRKDSAAQQHILHIQCSQLIRMLPDGNAVGGRRRLTGTLPLQSNKLLSSTLLKTRCRLQQALPCKALGRSKSSILSNTHDSSRQPQETQPTQVSLKAADFLSWQYKQSVHMASRRHFTSAIRHLHRLFSLTCMHITLKPSEHGTDGQPYSTLCQYLHSVLTTTHR